VVLLLLGLMAYLGLPREQDPEINFNWVQITVVLPGASPEDVEKRVLQPLEDAIKNVSDIRFISSAARDSIAGILVRFDDVPTSVFDKRINDLRREIQNKARAELPIEAKEPTITEVTSSNGFPTAQILLTGQADDEVLRALGREMRTDIERMPGVDRVFALGLHDPELRIEYSPQALAVARTAADGYCRQRAGWFRDVFAGRSPAGDQEWLVRVVGQDADPAWLADVGIAACRPRRRHGEARRGGHRRAGAGAGIAEGIVRWSGGRTVFGQQEGRRQYAAMVERISGYVERKNALLAPQGLQLQLMDDQTVPTREAISVMESNALVGLVLVVGLCWLFLGTRISLLVGLGLPFALCRHLCGARRHRQHAEHFGTAGCGDCARHAGR
jgi:multidrug efflux pump subunit AcrB